ncbi:transposase protein domain-containing protein [Phthorimaea operculella]|nr:transposase protein domain-containing protein [Phthorimaea operculella]
MSNHKCCVPGCPNREGSTAVLHKFPNPAQDTELFNSWLHAIGGEIIGLNNIFIYKYRRVCHLHFEEKYWCRNNRLSKIAVPTRNMAGLTKLKFTIDQQRLLRPIENIMDRRTSSQVPGTLYDVDMDEQHRYLRSIENITSEESSSKAKPVARCDVTLQYDPQIAKDNILTKTNLELASVTQLAESTTVTEAITKQSIYCRVSTESTTKPDHLDTADLQQQKTAGSGTEMEKKGRRGGRKLILKKLRKRVLVTPAEEELYNKVVRLGVKLKSIKGDKGRRFTLKEKILALSIMKQSPKGYRFLRKIFILPSPQTLLRVLSMANIRPGINKNTMAQIKKATEKMTVEDRLCIVLFDEMSLKPNVTYNDRKDRVTGFVTNGEDTKPEFADHAQVFMVRGLMKNYKQPVAYTFSQAATKGAELAMQLKTVITDLQAAGVIVVATVCDQDKGILPSECKETADVLLFFDNLFDSVNGSFEKNKHAKPLLGPATPTSCHKKVWEESKTMLREMKFLNPKKNTIEHVPTLKNWVWTLEGIELLLKN